MTKNGVIGISNYSGKWASADANKGCISLGLAVAQKGEQVLVQVGQDTEPKAAAGASIRV